MVAKRQVDAALEPIMRSAAMKSVDQLIRAVADKDVTLMLLGESGTGKELLARRAHELSSRRRGPFVPINCSGIPETLFESELFGHERGAFTGATERAKGKIAAAEHGTLFLDEIGEMPVAMQAKLLRFLENRRYMRVGGSTKIEADVRLICATLRPLEQDVRAGRFRADLYYRIQGISLRVPSLRERREDILPLLSLMTQSLTAKHRVPAPRLTRAAKAALLHYDWPGNVRELRNVVEALCLLRGGRRVRTSDLPDAIRSQAESRAEGPRARRSASVTLDLSDSMAAHTRRIVEAAMQLENGDKERTAVRLGISTRTVQRYVATGRVRA